MTPRQCARNDRPHRRHGRSLIGLVIFLLGFTVLLIIISHFYLLPAIEVSKGASTVEKQGLNAWSRLLMTILLIVLLLGMILSVRLGRMLFPRSRPARTRYVDAWRESGRRASLRRDSSETDE